MCILRRVKEKNGYLSNFCGRYTDGGTPMVGSKYCINHCPHFKSAFKFLHWEFVRCKYIDQLCVLFLGDVARHLLSFSSDFIPFHIGIFVKTSKATFLPSRQHPPNNNFFLSIRRLYHPSPAEPNSQSREPNPTSSHPSESSSQHPQAHPLSQFIQSHPKIAINL